MRHVMCIITLASFVLAGCGAKKDPVPAADILAARHPANLRLSLLYGQSCAACHAHPEAGAPLVGVGSDWQARTAQGDAVLLRHALEGYNGMPAGGQCFACTPDDIAALIRFMSTPLPPTAT